MTRPQPPGDYVPRERERKTWRLAAVIALVLTVLVTSWVFRPGRTRTPEEVSAELQSGILNHALTPVPAPDESAEGALVDRIRRDGRADHVVAGPDRDGHHVWVDERKHRIYVAFCSVGDDLVAGGQYSGGVMLDSNPEHVTEAYALTCVVHDDR